MFYFLIFTEAAQLFCEFSKLQEQWQCKVCMDETINMVFMPCGHTECCSLCAPALTKCPVCRSAIGDTVRIYLPWMGSCGTHTGMIDVTTCFRRESECSSFLNTHIQMIIHTQKRAGNIASFLDNVNLLEVGNVNQFTLEAAGFIKIATANGQHTSRIDSISGIWCGCFVLWTDACS